MGHEKNLLFFSAILILNSSFAYSQWNRGPKTPNDTLESTEIFADGKVVFSIYAPDAEKVNLRGDVVPWGKDVEGIKKENGVWTFTIPELKSGTYRYHFVVDE